MSLERKTPVEAAGLEARGWQGFAQACCVAARKSLGQSIEQYRSFSIPSFIEDPTIAEADMSGLLKRNVKSVGILLVGLFAGLALSTVIPRVDAAQASHNDLITAINNILTAIENAITDIGPTKWARVDLTLNPANEGIEVRNIIPPPDVAKTFSGRITGVVNPNGNNFVDINCYVPGGYFVPLVEGATSVSTTYVNEEFACVLLQVIIEDSFDSVDDPAVSVNLLVQYVESSDGTTLDS